MPQKQFSYRILILDGDPNSRETGKLLLESQGHEVISAGDGFEAAMEFIFPMQKIWFPYCVWQLFSGFCPIRKFRLSKLGRSDGLLNTNAHGWDAIRDRQSTLIRDLMSST